MRSAPKNKLKNKDFIRLFFIHFPLTTMQNILLILRPGKNRLSDMHPLYNVNVTSFIFIKVN